MADRKKQYEALLAARARYLQSLSSKAERIKQLSAACDQQQPDAMTGLSELIHQIAGSAGMHGLDQISDCAGQLDHLFDKQPQVWDDLSPEVAKLYRLLDEHQSG